MTRTGKTRLAEDTSGNLEQFFWEWIRKKLNSWSHSEAESWEGEALAASLDLIAEQWDMMKSWKKLLEKDFPLDTRYNDTCFYNFVELMKRSKLRQWDSW